VWQSIANIRSITDLESAFPVLTETTVSGLYPNLYQVDNAIGAVTARMESSPKKAIGDDEISGCSIYPLYTS
jgi:hypothetical protein